jgi:hypothetical protein
MKAARMKVVKEVREVRVVKEVRADLEAIRIRGTRVHETKILLREASAVTGMFTSSTEWPGISATG